MMMCGISLDISGRWSVHQLIINVNYLMVVYALYVVWIIKTVCSLFV